MGKCLLQGTHTYLPNHNSGKLTDSSSFVLQLISLAGLHSNATITTELSRAFKDEGMLAYVRLIQAREKELGVDVLTHQKWSGAPYIDGILGAIQSGSSSSKSMGEGNTEKGKFPPGGN
jgi:isocitrate lyase